MVKFLCVLLALAVAAFAAPLAPESRGQDFFVAFGYNLGNAVNTLYISTDIAQTVIVSTKTATVATLNLAAKSTQSVNVSPYYIPSLNSVGTQGLRVRSASNTSFTLIGLNYVPATTDAFLGFPINTLGKNYMAAGYNGHSSGLPGYMYVVAPEDGTTVTISGPRTLTGLSSGTVTHTLQSYGTVAVGINGGDITGFTVNSNKPVAVFGGSQCSNVPVNIAACNLLVEQIPPTNTWASDFVTTPLATRTAGDIIRVISNTTGTVVKVNGANVATLAFGAWYEFSSTVTTVIHTSFPALVMQYCKGSQADGVSSDPFQIWVPPVNQYSANYYISTPTDSNWVARYVNIIIESGTQSGLTLDNAPISTTWAAVTGSTYVYARLPITGGSHQVSHSSPIQQFAVIVYGYGSYDGFGYVGGSRFAPLQDPCTTTATIPGDGLDNDCDQRVDEEIRNGLDDDNDGLIDEDLTVDTCCYGNTQNPVLSVSSIAPVTIGCGEALPAVPTVSATVACANITNFQITPTQSTTPGSSCTYASITRTFTVTDACGRQASVQQVITVTQSTCGNGIVEAGEQCDGGNCCTGTCSFQSSATTCRASNGVCDVAETCTGSSASCPADTFAASSVTCRGSNGVCDVAETCTGSSASCPADSFAASSVTCRGSNGDCDVAETCTGSSASCPADSFASSSVTCRGSNGVCDVAETCTGSSASCPADAVASSSVVCRAAAGPCDVAESCTGSATSCPFDAFSSSTTVCRAAIGPCDVSETCSGSNAACPSDVSGSFETACAGLGLDFGNGPYSFLNYDVISFQDIVGPTGAIDGRAAAKNNVVVGTSYFGGYSVGYYVHSTGTDQSLPFALVAGQNVTFGGGAVYPDAIHNSPKENIFVGSGHIAGQADLVERATGNCNGNNGCLDSYFNAVQACYGGYQTAWAAQATNVNKNIEWSGLYLDCADPTSAVKQYYLTLTPAEMTQYTWISMSNCNANARWIITVPGTGPVTFTAGTFPAQANAVVYNVIGSGRTVNVQNIYLQGHLVAPFNTVNQPNGNIVGKVIAGNIPATLNINRAGSGCFTPQ